MIPIACFSSIFMMPVSRMRRWLSFAGTLFQSEDRKFDMRTGPYEKKNDGVNFCCNLS